MHGSEGEVGVVTLLSTLTIRKEDAMARKRITLSLDEDLLERIKQAAQKDDRKISNEVERILIKHYPPEHNFAQSVSS
ncbi:DUF6364 family protein [Planktothrix paucivesiculata]|uniref:Ribbon-helix-helix protein CopG domain-containing protein n=2 Tax=Microcoleaceae TaxID=1892252 RepID=A0A7Z9BL44_9CYAN|nr:DUF6364 family protein [Planktothrix paucivesiculata]VXD16785.1 hypothetical protein PL9631_250062 [Planktothrix paucivesiculata PCC 9631]